MTTPGWEGILDDDETILWQGQPKPGLSLRPRHIGTLIFGLFFAGFALFWMRMAYEPGTFFWAFGLIHFCAGLGVAFAPVVMPLISSRRTWYTLTDRRAFIARQSLFGQRKLKSYPITADTAIELETGTVSSIYFASQTRRRNKRTYVDHIGFERLDDAAPVLRMIRDVQNAQKALPE